jgi:hypothetical protein
LSGGGCHHKNFALLALGAAHLDGGRLGSGSGGRGRGNGGRLGSGSGGRGRDGGGRLGSGSGGRGRGDGGRLGSGSGGRGRGDVQSLTAQPLIAVFTPTASPNPTTCRKRLIRGSIVAMSRAETRSHSPGSVISLPLKWPIIDRAVTAIGVHEF